MASNAKPPDAFLSYTRFDDQHDRGKISEFRQELADEVRAVTGEPFEIFQDVDGIGVGEHWPDKLDEMLDRARFFIPILTPKLFQERGLPRRARRIPEGGERPRARNDLVLPIYYIECDCLEDARLPNCRSAWQPYDSRSGSIRIGGKLRYSPFTPEQVQDSPSTSLARAIGRARSRPMPATAGHLSAAAAGSTRREQQAGVPGQLHQSNSAAKEPTQRSPKLSLTAGTVFRDKDAPWCPELVVIPPGEFMMGSTEAERQWAIEQGARAGVGGLGEAAALGFGSPIRWRLADTR